MPSSLQKNLQFQNMEVVLSAEYSINKSVLKKELKKRSEERLGVKKKRNLIRMQDSIGRKTYPGRSV